MLTTKKKVSNLLKNLPDNCTIEQIQYHLYVLQKIEKGLKDVKEGRFYTTEEARKKLSKWLKK